MHFELTCKHFLEFSVGWFLYLSFRKEEIWKRMQRFEPSNKDPSKPLSFSPISSLPILPENNCKFFYPNSKGQKVLLKEKDIINKLIKIKWDKGSHTPFPPFGGSLYRSLFSVFTFHMCNNCLE